MRINVITCSYAVIGAAVAASILSVKKMERDINRNTAEMAADKKIIENDIRNLGK